MGATGSGTHVDLPPSLARVKGSAWASLAGIAGGLAVVLGIRIFGPQLGPVLGGSIAGAILGGDTGRIVAVNGAMDSVLVNALSA